MSDDHDMRSGRGRPAKKLKRVDQHDGTESGQEVGPMITTISRVDAAKASVAHMEKPD